jgi:hypothetical protein
VQDTRRVGPIGSPVITKVYDVVKANPRRSRSQRRARASLCSRSAIPRRDGVDRLSGATMHEAGEVKDEVPHPRSSPTLASSDVSEVRASAPTTCEREHADRH